MNYYTDESGSNRNKGINMEINGLYLFIGKYIARVTANSYKLQSD
jgi:hypothetical protein